MRINELKTSKDWASTCKVIILDPDGWDRNNYEFSFNEEKITKEEFEKRLFSSTIQMPARLKDIWK